MGNSKDRREPGEEKYKEVTNETCFTCEIPEEYCRGLNECVPAYRRWKRKEREKAKRHYKPRKKSE